MLDSTFLSLAHRQFGVVGRSQLTELGVSVARLSRARRSGRVVDVTSRAIRVASSPDTFLARCTAVSLHLGDRGFLSGPTAGRLHGLREMSPRQICAVVPCGDRPTLPDWVDVRSSSWFDVRRDRLALPGATNAAEPHRMLYDLAARLDDRRFLRAAEDCWHLGLVTPSSAARYLARHRSMGKDGTLRLERWLDLTLHRERPSESGLELDLVEALRAIGLPDPIRQHPLTIPSGVTIRVDLAWPDLRLAVEPGHSWWHGGDDGVRRDNDRRLGAQAIGWETIQLDESLRLDPAAAARSVRAVYLQRAELLAS